MDIYDIIKLILTIIYVISSLLGFIFIVLWLIMFLSRNPDKKKRNNIAKVILVSFVITVISMFTHFVVAVKQYSSPLDISTLPTFDITSDDLHGGVWDKKIGAKHDNLSPQLSWDKVSSAEKYAIVMIDHDGNDWLHWISIIDNESADDKNNGISNDSKNKISNNNKNNNLAGSNNTGDKIAGNIINVQSGTFDSYDNGYVGPYPPSGKHNYTVYVFALIGDTYSLDFQLDKGGTDLENIISQLDSGLYTDYHNIVAVGTIEGSYSAEK